MSELEELMEHIEEELEDIWDSVKTIRDEAKVQAYLARAEAKDEIKSLNETFDTYSNKMDLVRNEVARGNESIYDSARQLGKELLGSYERIKSILN